MESFIPLTKYNNHQRCEEGKPLFIVTNYSAYFAIRRAHQQTGVYCKEPFFRVSLGAEPLFTLTRRLQKWLG